MESCGASLIAPVATLTPGISLTTPLSNFRRHNCHPPRVLRTFFGEGVHKLNRPPGGARCPRPGVGRASLKKHWKRERKEKEAFTERRADQVDPNADWLSDYGKDPNRPKPKLLRFETPILSDENFRRKMVERARAAKVLRQWKKPKSEMPRMWFKRSPAEMANYWSDDRWQARYKKAYKRVIMDVLWDISQLPPGFDTPSYMAKLMAPYEAELSCKDLCDVLMQIRSSGLAGAFFEWMRGHAAYEGSCYAYTLVLRAHAKAKQAARAEALWEALLAERLVPDAPAYAALIQAYGRTEQWGKMMGVVAEMRRQGVLRTPTMFAALIGFLARAGMCRDMLAVWHEQKLARCQATRTTYMLLIGALWRARAFEDGVRVYEEMRARDPGVALDEFTHTMVVRMYGRLGRLACAAAAFATMKELGIEPNNVAYDTLINLYGRAGQYGRAADVFEDMQRSGCAPDIVTFTSLISLYGRAGLPHEALALFHEARAKGMLTDDRPHLALASMFQQSGEAPRAVETLEELVASGLPVSRIAWQTLIDCYARMGLCLPAVRTLRAMSQAVAADAAAATAGAGAGAARHHKDRGAPSENGPGTGGHVGLQEGNTWADGRSSKEEEEEEASLQRDCIAEGRQRRKFTEPFDKEEEETEEGLGGSPILVAVPSVSPSSLLSSLSSENEGSRGRAGSPDVAREVGSTLESSSSSSWGGGIDELSARTGRGSRTTRRSPGTAGAAAGEDVEEEVTFRALRQPGGDSAVPDARVLAHLMSRYARRRMVAEAEGLFNGMLRAGMRPGPECYRSLLQVYTRAGMVGQAERLLAAQAQARAAAEAERERESKMERASLGSFEGYGADDTCGKASGEAGGLSAVPEDGGPSAGASSNISTSASPGTSSGSSEEGGVRILLKGAGGVEAVHLRGDNGSSHGSGGGDVRSSGNAEAASAVKTASAPSPARAPAALARAPAAPAAAAAEPSGWTADGGKEARPREDSGRQEDSWRWEDEARMLLGAYAREGRVEDAERMLDRLEAPQAEHVASMLSMYVAAQLWEPAARLWAKVRRRWPCAADTALCNSFLQMFSLAGRYEDAEALFEGMRRAGPPPDSFTYNSLLAMYKRAGGAANLGKATALFAWMRAAQPPAHTHTDAHAHAQGQGEGQGRGQGRGQGQEQVPPAGAPPPLSKWHYNTMISICARGGRVAEARALFDEMRQRGLPPDDVTVSAMITAYDSAGMHEEAAVLLRRARAGDRQVDAVTINSMLQTYLHARKLREAEEVYARFVAEGGQPTLHMYSTLISVYARQRQAAKAEGVFARMKASGLQLDGPAYGAIINCCSKSGEVVRAAQLFEEMIAAGIKPTEVAYNTLIDMYGRAGDAGAAQATFKRMLDDEVQPSDVTYLHLLYAYGNARMWQRAEGLLVEMQAQAEAQPPAEGEAWGEGRLAPRLPHYSCLMSAYCRAGLMSRALAIFQELQQRGLKPDLVCFRILIEACVRFRRWSMVPELYSTMRVQGLALDEKTCSTLVDIFDVIGEKELAGRLREEMRSKRFAYTATRWKDDAGYKSTSSQQLASK